MNDVTVRKLEMSVRVVSFLAKNPMVFRKGSQGPSLIDQFNYVIARVQMFSAKHDSESATAHAHSTERGAARQELIEVMEQIRDCARGMAVTRPGVDEQFRMSVTVSDSVLLTRAQAFAANAEPLVRDFIEYEMPTKFLDELKEKTTAFGIAVADHTASRAAHVATKQQLDDAMRNAMDTLAQLDPIVINKLRDNPELLSQWQNVRHVERAWTTKPKTDPVPVAA